MPGSVSTFRNKQRKMTAIPDLSLQELQKFYVDVIPHHARLGMRIVDCQKGRLSIDLPFNAALAGPAPGAGLHSGAITTLIDTACGSVVPTLQSAPRRAATLDLRTDFLVSAPPGTGARCVAECFHFHANLAFVRASVYEIGNQSIVATASGTFAAFDSRPGDDVIAEALGSPSESFPAPQSEAGPAAYEQMMGVSSTMHEGQPREQMSFQDHLVGNKKLGILHGGAVASLLQVSALRELQRLNDSSVAKLFNFNVEFLGPSAAMSTWARAAVVSRSKRFANVSVVAYQRQAECTARATAQFILS